MYDFSSWLIINELKRGIWSLIGEKSISFQCLSMQVPNSISSHGYTSDLWKIYYANCKNTLGSDGNGEWKQSAK